ncbi:MAG: UbiD family decarboxylase [Magnetococcales bacterium]|nr:UbiD family decarboxylase [Magnetococcales bacterium]
MNHLNNRPTAFSDLRTFIDYLKQKGELVQVDVPVDPHLEITEICTRLLAEGGPAVLFTQVIGSRFPVLTNLFGTQERVGLAVGRTPKELEELGQLLSDLKQPEPPKGLSGMMDFARQLTRVRHMPTKTARRAPCREVVMEGEEIDLGLLPIQTCWPNDVGPLITWPVVITQGAEGGPVNLGIYRMQVLDKNRLIMRWLKHRGGAQHAKKFPKKMPVAVAIGCDPGTILAAVTPIPETLSEYGFAGLLREKRVETTPGLYPDLPVPARAEIILEGEVDLEEMAPEGPFGDHTGYYNEVEMFPVFTVKRVTMRQDPIYLSTFTGRPPDEPAILALALNRVFVPLLRKQFPEITTFHLSMEAASYRVAIIGLKKGYPGHAFRVMAGVWGFLRQFLYTKYIIVVDEEVDVENMEQVLTAIGLHTHGGRDLQVLTNTPIDYLDFASPVAGLGGKMGIDATTKMGAELDIVPARAAPTPDIRWIRVVLTRYDFIVDIRLQAGGLVAVARVDGVTKERGKLAIEAIQYNAPLGTGADQLWVVDADCNPRSAADLFWSMATRSDPSRDVVIDRESGRFAVDATARTLEETGRNWGETLRMDEETIHKVSKRWSDYGLPGSGEPIWEILE